MFKFKNILLFGLAIVTITTFLSTRIFAVAGQWTGSGSTIYYKDGNVGIGTTTPNDPLVINNTANSTGKVLVGDGPGSWWLSGSTSSGNGMNNIASNAYFNNGWNLRTPGKEGWVISNYATSNNQGYYKIFHMNSTNGYMDQVFAINGSGKVFVRELNVTLLGWPDNVFSENYKLKPLNEVEAYIKENKHLPEVPSEKEITEGGLDIGSMQKIQMQKIEELTLYSIEQEKRINSLEERLSRLERN